MSIAKFGSNNKTVIPCEKISDHISENKAKKSLKNRSRRDSNPHLLVYRANNLTTKN